MRTLTSDSGTRGLRFFGWSCLVIGALHLILLALGLVATWATGYEPDYNRVERLLSGCGLIYIASLHFDLAKERSR